MMLHCHTSEYMRMGLSELSISIKLVKEKEYIVSSRYVFICQSTLISISVFANVHIYLLLFSISKHTKNYFK